MDTINGIIFHPFESIFYLRRVDFSYLCKK